MATETTTVPGTISANDVKAMRQADTVSFHHHPQEGGAIRASKRIRNPGPFDGTDRSVSIAVKSSFSGKFTTTADDDDIGERVTTENSACFAMEYGASYSEDWQTVAHFLKAGDVLTLHWCADGIANGYLKGATAGACNPVAPGCPLHADTLRLKVKRGEKRFSFLLDTSICPDNSARMIRRR